MWGKKRDRVKVSNDLLKVPLKKHSKILFTVFIYYLFMQTTIYMSNDTMYSNYFFSNDKFIHPEVWFKDMQSVNILTVPTG